MLKAEYGGDAWSCEGGLSGCFKVLVFQLPQFLVVKV
jgi:hypothetical protein